MHWELCCDYHEPDNKLRISRFIFKEKAMLIRFHASAFLIITLSLGTLPGQSSNTTLVGRWDAGICYAVDVEGNYAYFGIGS